MANFKSVAVTFGPSQELAELFGIRQDLNQAMEFCDQVLRMYGQLAAADFNAFEALFTTAVIKYARCFSSGVRPRLSDIACPRFSPEQLAAHEFFLNYRNKFLAHSVNPYEQNLVTISVPAQPLAGWAPDRVNCHHVRHLVPGSQNVLDLRELAICVDTLVSEQMSAVEEVVLLSVRAIPVEDLLRLPVANAPSPSRNDIGRGRWAE